MKAVRWDREQLAIAGIVVLGAVVAGGLWILLFGRARGDIWSGGRRAEAPPRRGEVPAERHQNIGTVSTH